MIEKYGSESDVYTLVLQRTDGGRCVGKALGWHNRKFIDELRALKKAGTNIEYLGFSLPT